MATISNVVSTAPAPVPAVPVPVAPDAAPAPKVAAPGVMIVDDRTATIRDSRRRMLTVKRLNAIEKMRLARALAENSGNDSYANFAVVAASVRELDGEFIPFPMNTIQLEALVARLDDQGMEAALVALVSVSSAAQIDQAAVKN